MPYIKQEDRKKLDWLLETLGEQISSDGELAYCVYKLCLLRVEDVGESFSAWNSALGVLSNMQIELYRRKLGNYENKKLKENSDVILHTEVKKDDL